jgi:uncharacterized protein (DUF1499 family)
MRRLFSLILGLLIVLTGILILPNPAHAALPFAQKLFTGDIPDNLGVNDGYLASCPSSPNCVVSQNADSSHSIAPITYQGDRQIAKETLLKVLAVVPRTTIVEETENYIRTQSTSRLLSFVDDAEFYLPDNEKVIHLRSASRLGDSDLGVNRRRLEQIRLALADLGI